jgi:hypothetical protein
MGMSPARNFEDWLPRATPPIPATAPPTMLPTNVLRNITVSSSKGQRSSSDYVYQGKILTNGLEGE